MRKRRRSWIKRSGVILSTVLSLSAPGKVGAEMAGKSVKTSKKSKISVVSSDDGEDSGDGRPPKKETAGAGRAPPPPPDPPASKARSVASLRKESFVLPGEKVQQAPWRRGIVTTVFWVGEAATPGNPVHNHSSSWDPLWSKHYGGFDNPARKARKGFLPTDFVPKQNPFYVALPYTDFIKGGGGHKDEAKKNIPWFEKAYAGPDRSVCKGHWIAVRKGNKVCYAQWEDAGPFTTDDVDYVFGEAKPKPNANHGAGLDVSPAVRDFLGMESGELTDWKFVDFEEVPSGPWAELGDNNHFVINRRKADKKKAVAESDAQLSAIPSTGSS